MYSIDYYYTMRLIKKILLSLLIIVIIGFLIPQNLKMPVAGAGPGSYNPNSYWYYPWGKSVTHKGVDIFAKKGTPIHAATAGIVMFCGDLPLGGHALIILGPKWRMHYYAHLDTILTSRFSLVNHESIIAKVGDSGNAKGKAPHLHYVVTTLIPYVWRIDDSPLGYLKMFYLNPIEFLKG